MPAVSGASRSMPPVTGGIVIRQDSFGRGLELDFGHEVGGGVVAEATMFR